jgi:hypothetical protein
MSRMFWHLERYEQAASKALWSEEFPAFDQVLEIATSALGSGRGETLRFIAPDGAPPAQIEQLVALGAVELMADNVGGPSVRSNGDETAIPTFPPDGL